ncbi:MAG: ABC transporter permease [Chelatococcus sp.]|uniref:ABC transporter permease n=1 Tax=unclassified Chelatococcus TaxID=2638111 RepID=UPI001BD1676D|nr:MULTISPECIES: ABC transporter permease [unclassified Chelatococcus]MBS7742879.1 ABC transporter permease [Chelatococcus sp. HY11]MBX3540354.1 ABC transporter permease [Chelatococcus sp.]MBX3542003.1 ABC transporter permease [Chelatococcus sp.]MCO5074105.1 ABC transporter permease [Chelatococcus sp.]
MRLLLVPATLLVMVVLGAPLALLFRISLNDFSPTTLMTEAMTIDNYRKVLTDPWYQEILITTVLVALCATLAALVLAMPSAYALARMQSRWKSLCVILTLFPLMIGGVVRTSGWMALAGTDGALNVTLLRLGLIGAPIQIMYTRGMVMVGLLALAMPYMILTISATIEAIPRHLEEAALNLGASPLIMFRRVIMPLAWPGIATACVLVFIMAMNAYSTPRLLGGPQFRMMSPTIYEEFTRSHNWPGGAALAFILLITTILLIAGTSLLAASRSARR